MIQKLRDTRSSYAVIERTLFYDRLNNHCRQCEQWKGVCLKGHALASDLGCPLRKFEPVGDAGYATEPVASAVVPKLLDCCGSNAAMPAMTWPQVLAGFASSMVDWIRKGLPLVDGELHGQRYDRCKTCTKFRNFYCEHCRCVAYFKTKLATEECPLPEPRWVSAIAPDE